MGAMREPPQRTARVIARVALAVLLLAMAIGQLADIGGFADLLRDYELVGAAAGAVAVAIPLAELAAASALLAGRRLGGRLGLAVAVFWTGLGALAFARGLAVENCGCFGVYLGQELRWWVLMQDVYFLALAWYAAAASGVGVPLPRLRATTTP
jgi:hypothetical protein